MLTIHKYPLPLQDVFMRGGLFELALPQQARSLTIQEQRARDGMFLWAMVDPERPLEVRLFRVLATREPIRECPETLRYIETVQFDGGQLVLHVFEIVQSL